MVRHRRGVPTIAPWLSVTDAGASVAFYTDAFGAVELERLEHEAGVIALALLSVEGAEFWIQQDPTSTPTVLGGSPTRMILSVGDPDAVFDTAVSAGATVISPIAEDYGWRIGRIADPDGHHWEIGRRLPG